MKIEKNENSRFYSRYILNISNNEIFYLDFKESILRSRIKRAPNDKTLLEATRKWDYTYWLSQEDITDIARLEYKQFSAIDESNAEFEVLGSLSQLHNTLTSFKSKIDTEKLTKSRLTLIINLEGAHWVTLVVSYQDSNYVSYYTDSKNNPMPSKYAFIMFDHFHMHPLSLSPGFMQQQDGYNCGLWALENAADINRILDHNQPINYIFTALKRRRNKEYFDRKRVFFSKKISADLIWRERHPLLLKNLEAQEESPLPLDISSPRLERTESDSKRFKTTAKAEREKVINLLEVFVETFMSAFIKKLGAYHLLTKEERLTEEALKIELKTGVTAALLGIGIARGLVGSIPSLVASLRMISGKYYVPKDKAQKITKIFSEFKSDSLSFILAEAAVAIFHSYENQFMQVTDKAGDKVAMEKLAEDAVDRALNYIGKDSNRDKLISKQLIEEGVLQGPSEKFFDPSIKRARLRISGYTIQDKSKNKINTANLYEKTGLVVLGKNNQPSKFYAKEDLHSNQYGYRRLFEWEKENDGELKKNLQEQYIDAQSFQKESILQFISNEYPYVLHTETNPVEARPILDKIENRYPSQSVERHESKKPIYFNLRKPVKNFSGRIQILEQLHRTLMLERTTAIVPSWSKISISPISRILSPSAGDFSPASSGSKLSISGLGGIGKTQLALRYAELYADEYDHNVLWINAETLENLGYSFNKLAVKIQIATRDRYEQEKSLVALVEEIYDYFSDRKSLFIYDNVESFNAIKAYLPKSRPDNNPTVLITSRFSDWDNIATVLSLNVFTEQETEELIEKSLDLQANQNKKIRELNQLLQGLPLALQQAMAYIKLRRNTDTSFSLDHYIELYKEKNKEILNFNFSRYSNDPYLKTVFTTWLITLDKIKKEPLGNDAIDILNILAYLYPDNISNEKILYFNYIKHNLSVNDLDRIMQLLSSYSMINSENQSRYTIHRLVQQVMRLKLEENQVQFKETVEKVQKLMWHWQHVFKRDDERAFHDLHFLLYMSEHKELIGNLVSTQPEKTFFDNLLKKNAKYTAYFIDLAYKKFTKEKFLKFLGDAIAYYIKLGTYFYLAEILNYLEQQRREGVLSKENIKYITEHFNNVENPILKFKRYSTIPEKKANQRRAMVLLCEFKTKVFGDKLDDYDDCLPHSLKRSTCLPSEAEEDKAKKIRNQRIKSHFKKLGQISGYVSSALMTKDILSAMLQGHFAEVATSFGLIASSILSQGAAKSLFTQGKNLASEASALEKSSGLKSKVFDILFNEEVVSIGKRQFLGKAMQVASPFFSRATSIFFAYNLNNEIKAYKMGDKTVLPDIISNSIIVGIDGIEAGIEGAEFLGIISGVSAFTGPLGEGIAVLAWLGAEGYAAEQKVEAIEKYVDLSREEQAIQFLRAFFHIAPSEYLQVKANNAQSVEHAIDLLKENTAIKWYVFPSFYNETVVYKDNVFVDRKNLILGDSNPDELNKGHLFCLSGTLDTLSSSCKNINVKTKTEYFCQHALGVTYAFNRTSNTTLINLGEGEDKAIALANSPTLFFVENGKKLYIGNDAGNMFNLRGNSISGLLQGGDGSDILILDNFYPEKSNYLLIDAKGFLCGKNNHTIHSIPPLCSPDEIRIEIDQIEQIYGRKNQQDIIYPNQDIRFIDGHGGKNKEQPDRLFITEHAYKNLKFVLRNNTLILFSINTAIDSIDYRIPADEVGETRIKYSFKEPIQHRFFFECSLTNIETITVANNTLQIVVLIDGSTARKTFAMTISDHFVTSEGNHTKNTIDLPKNISYFFENTEIKLISHEQLCLQETGSNNKTLDEKISLFSELANRLEKTLSVQLINNITISIGQGKHEIFYINNLLESHIVGNGGENVYIISPEKNITFPLSKVTLYDNSTTDLNELVELTDTLDLREVVKKYKQIYPNAVISPHVFPAANDLILTLSNAVYSPTQYDSYGSYDVACFLPWATIQLKDALLNNTNWYQKLDIFLDIFPRNIVPLDEEFWTLAAAPLIFTEDKKIIFITNQDIEEGTKFQILKNIGSYGFFRNETDLILTNAFIYSIDYCTIICHQFYQISEMKKKILSASFEFFDQEILPQDYEEEINHAFLFSHFSEIVSSNIIDLKDQAFLSSIMMHTPDNQSTLPQPIVRHKRQVELEEKRVVNNILKSAPAKRAPKRVNQIVFPQMTQNFHPISTFNEKERILAISDDYLEKYDDANSKRKFYGKKNHNQKQNKKQKASSFVSVREKKVKSPLMDPPFYVKKNKNNCQRTLSNYTVQNKLKSLAKSQTENLFQTLSFSKSEAAKLNKNFFKPKNYDKKGNFFKASKPLYHLESFKPTVKSLSNHSKLIYIQNKSESKNPSQNTLSSHIESPNLHSTLMLLDFITRKSLRNPVKPIYFDRKAFKNIKKVERQTDRIKSKVFGMPIQKLH